MHAILQSHNLSIALATASLLGCALVVAACGNEPPGPIVGTWEDMSTAEMDSSGMSMTYTFGRDGTLDITWQRPLLPDTVLTADYEVQWDSVLTLSDDQGSEQFITHVAGDTLTLRSEDGAIQHYARQTD